ncbi:hypothetical protein JHK85_017231 [Glycine max]|nr:hypothetical protein JHK85_017231 [Glycine max]
MAMVTMLKVVLAVMMAIVHARLSILPNQQATVEKLSAYTTQDSDKPLSIAFEQTLVEVKTKIQRKTLTPKWHEEFKIPIITWESDNVLVIAVCDKDHFYDDILGFLRGDTRDVSGLLHGTNFSNPELTSRRPKKLR